MTDSGRGNGVISDSEDDGGGIIGNDRGGLPKKEAFVFDFGHGLEKALCKYLFVGPVFVVRLTDST